MKKFLLASCACALLASCGTGAPERLSAEPPMLIISTGTVAKAAVTHGAGTETRTPANATTTGTAQSATEETSNEKEIAIENLDDETRAFLKVFSGEAEIRKDVLKDNYRVRKNGQKLSNNKYEVVTLNPDPDGDDCSFLGSGPCILVFKNKTNGVIGREAVNVIPTKWLDGERFVAKGSMGDGCWSATHVAIFNANTQRKEKEIEIDDSVSCDAGSVLLKAQNLDKEKTSPQKTLTYRLEDFYSEGLSTILVREAEGYCELNQDLKVAQISLARTPLQDDDTCPTLTYTENAKCWEHGVSLYDFDPKKAADAINGKCSTEGYEPKKYCELKGDSQYYPKFVMIPDGKNCNDVVFNKANNAFVSKQPIPGAFLDCKSGTVKTDVDENGLIATCQDGRTLRFDPFTEKSVISEK